jgi:hypothetical protein
VQDPSITKKKRIKNQTECPEEPEQSPERRSQGRGHTEIRKENEFCGWDNSHYGFGGPVGGRVGILAGEKYTRVVWSTVGKGTDH